MYEHVAKKQHILANARVVPPPNNILPVPKTLKKPSNKKQNSREDFVCVYCDKQFLSEKARLIHLRTVHLIPTSSSPLPKNKRTQSRYVITFRVFIKIVLRL